MPGDPCNTAHVWHDAIESALRIPILHIADVALAAVGPLGAADGVGLMGTTGLLQSEIYQSRGNKNIDWVTPSDEEQQQWVMPGIRAVKANQIEESAHLLRLAAEALVRRGAKRIVIACTEIPIALRRESIGVTLADPAVGLAHACVAWGRVRAIAAVDTEPSVT